MLFFLGFHKSLKAKVQVGIDKDIAAFRQSQKAKK
jgi:hypothetical protein